MSKKPLPGLNRRRLLQTGLALGAAGVSGHGRGAGAVDGTADDADDPRRLADPPWLHQPGRPFSNYGRPADDEAEVIRWIAANPAAPGNGVSWCPLHRLEGALVPNGLHFERHHHGVPAIDPAAHRLLLHGAVERPLLFAVDDLLQYPLHSKRCFIECGGNSAQGWNREPTQVAAGYWHGLASCSEWTGIPLRALLAEAAPTPAARWLIAEGADAFRMNVSVPLDRLPDDAMLALYQNGERLRPENGYPLRLLLPGWEGVTHVKWLRRLQLSDRPVMARNETGRYTDLLGDGTARQFSFFMEVKSLITRPSPGQTLRRRGWHQISGLAWSGRGRIERVEVSVDGGRNWHRATLDGSVEDRCFTRFRHPWRWQGETATLLSRAYDDSGARQPDRDELIDRRGRNGAYHYNAVTVWEIDEDGEIGHVYL